MTNEEISETEYQEQLEKIRELAEQLGDAISPVIEGKEPAIIVYAVEWLHIAAMKIHVKEGYLAPAFINMIKSMSSSLGIDAKIRDNRTRKDGSTTDE